MSILKNFVNPWESSGELGSKALGTEALEGNVVETPNSDKSISSIDIAVERTNLGKGNLMILFCSKVGTVDEEFSKDNLELGNDLWDYFVTYQNLYEVLNRVKKYQTKHSNILLQNVVIHSHGRRNAINVENIPKIAVSSLYGKDVKSYMNDNLDEDKAVYKAMKLLEFIGDNMADGGNIIFLACSAGYEKNEKLTEKQKAVGDVSMELGKFYSSQGKTINLFFNKNPTNFGKISNTEILGMPWGKGLSLLNTGWRIIQSNPNLNEMKVTEMDNDIAIYKTSSTESPNYDLIKPI